MRVQCTGLQQKNYDFQKITWFIWFTNRYSRSLITILILAANSL